MVRDFPMKKRLHLVSILSAFIIAGSSMLHAAAAPRTIEITANDQMKYSLATMTAAPGESIKVVMKNLGTLPKEAMGHNWVLLKAGTDINAFAMAAMTAKDTEYIPPAHKDKVIASIKVLGPNQSGDVTFTAPAAGEYIFLCSFPGHYMLMKGTLTVK
jgi:azurin